MKRTLVSLAVAAACQPSIEALRGRKFASLRVTEDLPPARSFVTYVPSAPDWSSLGAPADLEPGDAPLYRGEIGTLDCGYTFKPSRPPLLIGADFGSGRDVAVTGRWVGDKLEVIEHVKTGPGTPFFDTRKWAQIGEAHARREYEAAKNLAMRERLEGMAMTRTWFDGKDVRIEPVTLAEFTPEAVDAYWKGISPHHGRETMRISEDGQLTAKAQAPYFWHPVGSMGEEVDINFPADPHCAMKPQCPGAVGKGCYLCEPGPFEGHVPRIHCPALPDHECTHQCVDVCTDAADMAEVERINLTGARYRESVRLSPMGSEPWDFAAGECS